LSRRSIPDPRRRDRALRLTSRARLEQRGAPGSGAVPAIPLSVGPNTVEGSHLAKQVQIRAAHRQHVLAALEMNIRSFILASGDVRDRTEIHDNRSMYLNEVFRIELRGQFPKRRANHRLARRA